MPSIFLFFFFVQHSLHQIREENWLIGENKNVDNVGILHFCHVGLQDTQKNAKKRG